jgi:DNA-binding LacI/PurR family transcriptional regulator
MQQVRRVGRRRAPKEVQISMDLRRRIIEGDLKPGSQLPKRVDLEHRFSVSPLTIQRAVDRLIEEGFVYAKTGQGTFVADNPPHLSRYGLVFPSHPGDRGGWSTFYTALSAEAQVVQRQTPEKLAVYQGLELAERHEEREKLIEEVETHQLAGLIFVFAPKNFVNTPILQEERMARVAIMSEPDFGVPAVSFDGRWDRAIEYFKQRGRKRIALMTSSTIPQRFTDSLRASVAEAGMIMHPYWQHAVHPTAPEAARNIVHLMCLSQQGERPDALFITDDNLAPHATAGLLAAGVTVPEEMDVVAHANFPYVTTSVVPSRRLGFDVRQVLQHCLDSIDAQRRGEAVEMFTKIEAKFEDE